MFRLLISVGIITIVTTKAADAQAETQQQQQQQLQQRNQQQLIPQPNSTLLGIFKLSENDTEDQVPTSAPCPGDLKLTVHYHKAPNILNSGEPLNVTCSASVGSTGYLTWRLDTVDGHTIWEQHISGPFFLRDVDMCLILTHNVTRTPKGDGSVDVVIDSTLKIVVKPNLDGANISCRVYPDDQQTEESKDRDTTDDDTPSPDSKGGKVTILTRGPFRVTHLPHRPYLSLTFIDLSVGGQGRKHKSVAATCTGHVGIGGSMTWVLFGGAWLLTTRIALDGDMKNLKFGPKKIIHELNKTVSVTRGTRSHDEVYGPTIVSKLTVSHLTPALEEAAVACYAVNVSTYQVYNPGKDALSVAKSLRQKSNHWRSGEPEDFPKVKRAFKGVAGVVALLLFTALFCAYKKRKFSDRKPQREMTVNSDPQIY